MLRHLLSGALVLLILATALIAHAQAPTGRERTKAAILERMRNLGIVPGSAITIGGARFEIASIEITFDSNNTPQIVVQFRRQ